MPKDVLITNWKTTNISYNEKDYEKAHKIIERYEANGWDNSGEDMGAEHDHCTQLVKNDDERHV